MTNRKVLVIGPSNVGALPESYARAFERLGMEVIRFDSEQAMMRASRFTGNRIVRRAMRSCLWNAVNREAVEVVERVRPALIFAVNCKFFHPETIRNIRQSAGVPFVNYYPDHPYIGVSWDPREPSTLRRDLIETLRQYTIVFMWERGLVKRLRGDGVEARYLPFAVDPEISRPQSVAEGLPCDVCKVNHDVSFVATYTRFRCAEVAAIKKHTIAIWGGNWPRKWRTLSGQHRAHPPIWGTLVGDVYARAPLSLNVLNAENLGGPNMRTFEVPGSGGVMLARYSAEQDEFFPENEAAVYYRSPEELDDKIAWVLGDPELRARLRRNAVRLAAEQTYDVRAACLLHECGFETPSKSISRDSASSGASLAGFGSLA